MKLRKVRSLGRAKTTKRLDQWSICGIVQQVCILEVELETAGTSLIEWLVLVQHELLLFAGIFFLIGALDEFVVDLAWLWLRLTGRTGGERVSKQDLKQHQLKGTAAVFIPAWQEAQVIGSTIRHCLSAWPQEKLRLYVGCYANDRETIRAIITAADGDARLRLVVHEHSGPTTKADCLNRLYQALREDERRANRYARLVLMHDAEDMVDPAALPLIDLAMETSDYVQIPVMPAPYSGERWVANHYCDEFAEAHGKALVVRDAIGTALPAAGVGCAFSRATLARIASMPDKGSQPFSVESLTEDYELGLRVRELGGRSRFLRFRDENGQLIATRACFPTQLASAVRQKTRWLHGIAFQSWDRLGWNGSLAERWMRLRDRRGPLTALVLFIGYSLLALAAITAFVSWITGQPLIPLTPFLKLLLLINFASFAWRAAVRFAFTARDYGKTQGLLAVLRIPLSNIIAIMAGRRALFAYVRSLGGQAPSWDKTDHDVHPALSRPARGAA